MCLESYKQSIFKNYGWYITRQKKKKIIKFDALKAMKYIHSTHFLIIIENHSEEYAIDIVSLKGK